MLGVFGMRGCSTRCPRCHGKRSWLSRIGFAAYEDRPLPIGYGQNRLTTLYGGGHDHRAQARA